MVQLRSSDLFFLVEPSIVLGAMEGVDKQIGKSGEPLFRLVAEDLRVFLADTFEVLRVEA